MLKICCLLFTLCLASAEANRTHVTNFSNDNEMYEEWITLDKELQNMVNSAIMFLLPRALEATRNLNLTTQCTSQLLKVFSGAKVLDLWALKFIDSNGKMIDGLLQGTISALGNYHECIDIIVPSDEDDSENSLSFQGKYCVMKIKLQLPSNKKSSNINEFKKHAQLDKSLSEVTKFILSKEGLIRISAVSWGLCIPSGCSWEDVEQVVQYVGSKLSFLKTELTRCEIKEETPFDTSILVSIIFFSFAGLLVLIGSLIELYTKIYDIKVNNMGLKILLAFSLIQNTKRLLDTKDSESTLGFLHGFRVLSLVWVIAGHTFQLIPTSSETHANSFQILEYVSRYGFQLIMNGFYSVDSFFFMSGMLQSYKGLKAIENLTISQSFFYVFLHRLWRIYPAYIFSILSVFFLPLLGSGPIYNQFKDKEESNCEKYWWTNILFINNVVLDRPDICLFQSWFLSCDFQLFLILFIPMVVMVRRPKVGIVLNVIIVLASISYIAFYTWAHDLSPIIQLPEIDVRTDSKYFQIYSQPFMHVQPYFIGFLFGYWLMKMKNVTLSKKCQFFGWILFITFMYSTIFVVRSWNAGTKATLLESVFYKSMSRIPYSLAISWMIFCCYTGCGGIVNTILSWKAWYPVSRLCFAAYLMSLTIQWATVANSKSLLGTTIWDMVWRCIGDIFFSFLAAFVLSMLVEAPSMSLEKLFFISRNDEDQNKLKKDCNMIAGNYNTFNDEVINKTARNN